MKPCARLLVALLALIASTASLTGGSWATPCEMDGTRVEHASVQPAGADPVKAAHGLAGLRHRHAQDTAPDRHAQDTAPDGRPMPSCPLAAMHAPCAPVVLAVGPSYALDAPLADQASQPAVPETPPDLLFASTLFRPPQG